MMDGRATLLLDDKWLEVFFFLSIHLSLSRFVDLSIYFICLPVCLSICFSIYLSICLSAYPSIYLPVYPFYLSIYHLSVSLSFYLSIYLRIYRSIYWNQRPCLLTCLTHVMCLPYSACHAKCIFADPPRMPHDCQRS